MPRASYFLGTSYVGCTEIPQNPDRLNSIAWFCEQCGRDWARVIVEGATWAVEFNRCDRCGPAHSLDNRVPGSILRQWFFTSDMLMGRNKAMALENLPEPLLQRELLLAIAWAERRAQPRK